MTVKMALLGAAAALVATGASLADDHAPKSWYVGLGLGVNWVDDNAHLTYELGDLFSFGPVSYDTGYVIAGSIGRDFGASWRVELEAAFRGNDIDRFCPIAAPCFATDADVSEFSQMINVLYDISLQDRWEMSVGAGLGGNLVTVSHYIGQDIDDYVFAAQLMAQVSYALAAQTRVFADYRHMVMGDPMLGFPAAPGDALELEKTDTSLMLGLRFGLQQDAAPIVEQPKMVEKPVVEAPREFIVFFGFNKSHLTSEAVRVVSEAAEAARKHGSASISIVGHTDTSGSTDYNEALSMRRAQSVKDSLVAHGIEQSMISTAGRGETELLVNTGDGVKEPQNRRAKIDVN